ncbi:hypothetical protein, partial [Butyrivibrio sp. INlla14]|uniref:hypothetical protein n=1 Tax=Butyrivibrio sp. INlla14 TaxID=1520808 RepID=UPI000876C500
MSKKFLTKLLALTLCAGLVLQPVTAFADTPVESETTEVVAEEVTDEVTEEIKEEVPEVKEELPEEVTPLETEAEEVKPMDNSSLPVLKAWIDDGWLYIDSIGDDYFYDIVVDNGAITTSNIPYNLNKYCNEIGLASGSYKVTVQALKKHTYEISSQTAELTYDFVADDIVLRPLTNVKIEEDILTFDAYAENCLYFVKVDGHDPIIATTNRVDLIYNFSSMGFTPGKYMLHITATKQNFKPISQTYDIEYAYAMEPEPEPEPKIVILKEDSISSNIKNMEIKYGKLCETPTFNSSYSQLEYTFAGWEEYSDEYDPEYPDGFRPCKGFFEGKYRAVLKVRIRDGYGNYELDPFFKLYVNGIGWRCIVTSYDENFNMTSMTFASPTYDIETPELPEP